MARVTNLPAIEQVREQIDLDAATTEHLTKVSYNVGFRRPKLFWNDDEIYRAVVRGAAMDLRVVKNAFARALTNLLGPRKTQIGVMFGWSIVPGIKPDEDGFYLLDRTGWPQVGSLIANPYSVANEEEIEYGFLDPDNSFVTFRGVATVNHPEHTPWAFSTLNIEARKKQTQITLLSGANFPTIASIADRFAVWVARGTDQEELHEVTARTASVLTLGLPLEYNHEIGTQIQLAFITQIPTLTVDHAAGAVTVVVTDGRFFQQNPDGLYIVNRGEENEEWLFGNAWTLAPNQLGLGIPTALDHAAGETVEYAQFVVPACPWNIFETKATDQHTLTLLIPSTCAKVEFGEGSYLHEALDVPGAGIAVAAAVSADDVLLTIPHALAWETMIGLADPNHPCDPIYPMRVVEITDGFVTETKTVSRMSRVRLTSTAQTGDTTISVEAWLPVQDMIDQLGPLPINAVLDRGNPNQENVVVTAIDPYTNTITLNAPLAPPVGGQHEIGEWLEPQTDIVFRLGHGLINNYAAYTMTRSQTMYAPAIIYPPGPGDNSEDLQNGSRVWVPGAAEDTYGGYYSPGNIVEHHHMYQFTQLYTGPIPHPSDAQAIERIPGRQLIDVAVVAGTNTITLDDASMFPITAQAPYDVRINPGHFTEEIVPIGIRVGNVLTLNGTSLLTHNHAIGEEVVLQVEKIAVNTIANTTDPGGVWIDFGFQTQEFIEYGNINNAILKCLVPVEFKYQHPAGSAPASIPWQPGSAELLAQVPPIANSLVASSSMNGIFDVENQQKLFYLFGGSIKEMLVGEFGIVDQLKAAGINVEVEFTGLGI